MNLIVFLIEAAFAYRRAQRHELVQYVAHAPYGVADMVLIVALKRRAWELHESYRDNPEQVKVDVLARKT